MSDSIRGGAGLCLSASAERVLLETTSFETEMSYDGEGFKFIDSGLYFDCRSSWRNSQSHSSICSPTNSSRL